MFRQSWIALAAAAAVSGLTASAQAQYYPTAPISAPVVQFVDNHQQPDSCRSGVMGGATTYFLRPYINQNIAFITTTGIGSATPLQEDKDFDWNFHVAPAVWLGWSSKCGVGFRGRYFHFDQDCEPKSDSLDANDAITTVVSPPVGLSPLLGLPPRGFQSPGVFLQDGIGEDTLTVKSDLKIQTMDAEATFAHEWCHFGLLMTVGGRYLQMTQNYHATLTNIPTFDSSEQSLLDAGHNFYGGGPTGSLMCRWEFGRSGMAVFGSARTSLLIGRSKTKAQFTEVIFDPVNGDQNNQATTQSRENSVMPIAELEAGFEYSRALGRTRLFMRGAAVNHTYFDAGSSSSRDGNLSLFGAQMSMGFNY